MKHSVLLFLLLSIVQKHFAQPAPVIVHDDTLFTMKVQVGSFTPQERAAAIAQRIINVTEQSEEFIADSLTIVKDPYGYNVKYGSTVVMIVLPVDTPLEGLGLLALAELRKEQLASVMLKNHKEWSYRGILKKSIYAAIAISIFILLVWGVNWYYRKLSVKIIALSGVHSKQFKIGTYPLLTPARLSSFLLFLIKSIRLLIILIALYAILPVLFSLFPETKQWADSLIEYTINPIKSILDAIVDFIPNFIRIIVVYGFVFYLVKGLHFITQEIAKGALTIKGFYADWAKPTFNIIRFLLYAFMLIVIWPYLPGSGSPAFQGVSVFLGLLISFGSSSAIANAVAGLVITYMRPFKLGDRVKIGEVLGDVIEKNMLVTRIRTPKNEDVTLPNSSILSGFSINYSSQASERGLIINTSVTIGYDAPWRKVHELLVDAALATEHLLDDPKPFVLQTALNDFYVSYQINAYTRSPRLMVNIYSELHQNIQDKFNEGGIEIMSPHYGAIRNGNTTTIPETYRPQSYKPDTFTIKKDE
ncbi:MAG: mechanosensitive ion channel family protein [Bacteroidia bacterium]|jgi:small-conductance mechanosensitive channel|nr:mechanosensitive ion channel family protein [Bacteroidia bacterium]